MLQLSFKFSPLTPQTLHMDRYILFMARKNATMYFLKRTFLTGISRGIVKHSGNLCRTVGISASQTGEIHLEVLQITHLGKEKVLQFQTNLVFKTSNFFSSQLILLFTCTPCARLLQQPQFFTSPAFIPCDFAHVSLKRQSPFLHSQKQVLWLIEWGKNDSVPEMLLWEKYLWAGWMNGP